MTLLAHLANVVIPYEKKGLKKQISDSQTYPITTQNFTRIGQAVSKDTMTRILYIELNIKCIVKLVLKIKH